MFSNMVKLLLKNMKNMDVDYYSVKLVSNYKVTLNMQKVYRCIRISQQLFPIIIFPMSSTLTEKGR